MDVPPRDDAARIRQALKAEPVGWREVTRRGQTNASHWLVELPSGTNAFVKSARGDDTASWIRDEHLFYVQTRGATFLPRMLGWHDDGERPVIALEDLSAAHWPPPWEPGHVDAVLACLAEVAATTPPPDLPSVADRQFDFQGWIEIEDDPEPFLALRLCSKEWLEARCRSCASPPRSRRSRATRSCTSTCGATTSASATAAPSWSTGTSPASGTRWPTSRPGSRASTRKGTRARRDPPRWRRRSCRAPRGLLRRARRSAGDPRSAARPDAAAPAGPHVAPLGSARAGPPSTPLNGTCKSVAPATPC